MTKFLDLEGLQRLLAGLWTKITAALATKQPVGNYATRIDLLNTEAALLTLIAALEADNTALKTQVAALAAKDEALSTVVTNIAVEDGYNGGNVMWKTLKLTCYNAETKKDSTISIDVPAGSGGVFNAIKLNVWNIDVEAF